MKQLTKLFAVFTLLSLSGFAACNKVEEKDTSVSLSLETDMGELGNFISFPEQNVVINLYDTIHHGEKVKLISATLPVKVDKDVCSNYEFGFSAIILDENQQEITTLPDFKFDKKSNYQNGVLRYYLSEGETNGVLEKYVPEKDWPGDEEQQWNRICEEGKSIFVKALSWKSVIYTAP